MACEKEEKGSYKTVSELISNRNNARFENKAKNQATRPKKKDSTANKKNRQGETKKKSDDLSPVVIYEEKVEIISSSSNKRLAKAIAYINKKGQIVRIKIVK